MLWVARLALPDEGGAASFLVVAALELALPVVARARSATLWHPEHIAERYGLFTLILLGESVLASTVAVVDALAHVDHFGHLALIAGCGLTLAAGMWWVYFHGSPSERLTTMREALTYGYGHYVIFAAAGAFSAGIEVTVGHDTTSGGLTGVGEALCLTLPVAVFLVMVWLIVLRHELPPLASAMFVGLSVLLALTALLPSFFVAAAVVMVAVVAVVEVARVRARRFV
jgi:low temperature requirement protein LtrA